MKKEFLSKLLASLKRAKDEWKAAWTFGPNECPVCKRPLAMQAPIAHICPKS